MHKLNITLLLLTIFLLSACSEEAPPSNEFEIIVAPTTSEDEAAGSETADDAPAAYPSLPDDEQPGYPPPATVYVPPTGYPGSATPVPTIAPSPEELVAPEPPVPAEGMGAVIGQLYHKDTSTPGSNLTIYLGVKVEGEPGPAYFISTQRNSSPQDNTNAGGYFVINDVEPGLYALVIGSVIGSRVLENPETGQEYWLDVTAGEVTDVGQVVFTFP